MTEDEDVSTPDTMAPMRPVDVAPRQESPPQSVETVFDIQGLTAAYGSNVAIKDVGLDISRNVITAVIGPSGCGKSTFIRCLNRMNDEVSAFRHEGRILYHGIDLYGEASTRSRCAGGSGWSSRSRTRSRRRSTTTWPGRRASWA